MVKIIQIQHITSVIDMGGVWTCPNLLPNDRFDAIKGLYYAERTP
ncbi:MAG: hypothetical protein P9X24_06350 [Candidatus Hatepunaea meridiana]|nr:hypothetical protein [Candidatus Hatepunaea meridiana]